MRAIFLALALSAIVPSHASAFSPLQAVASSAPLSQDTAQTTRSGASFTAPKDWTVTSGDGLHLIVPPEQDSIYAVVDIPEAADAAEAIAKAWQIQEPDFARTPRLTTKAAPKSGWGEATTITYETSPSEQIGIQATALPHDGHWTVSLVKASNATLDKRYAAVALIFESLRPAGYVAETFAGRQAHPLDAARIEALRRFIETSMRQLEIPGVGYALYDQGRIVYEGGIGVRELGRPEPVDANTLFMVASNTKSMATLLLAKMVDEGRVSWDQPVVEVFPSFRLGSDATTRKVLVRHLVCACTGLPRKDMIWALNTPPGTPDQNTFDQLAETEPTSAFGDLFQYNNLMASAAGYVAAHLAYPDRPIGEAFDTAMRDLIFRPLGMNSTHFDTDLALRSNHASPHALGWGEALQVAGMDYNRTVYPHRPAGGAWSSAHDMIRYVANEINQGDLGNGQRLVSAEALLKRREPSVPIGETAQYGMGLEVDTAWGVPVVHHGGAMLGYMSDIILLPEAGVGAVILTNAVNGHALLRPFMRRLVEVLYDGKPEAAADVAATATRLKAQHTEYISKLEPAALAAQDLAPAYESPELGRLIVKRSGDEVLFRFISFESPMALRQNQDGSRTFVSVLPGLIDILELVVGEHDGKRALIVQENQHEYAFVEVD